MDGNRILCRLLNDKGQKSNQFKGRIKKKLAVMELENAKVVGYV